MSCCADPYNCTVPIPQDRTGLVHLNYPDVPEVTEEMVERAAKALVASKGVSPNTLFEIHVFSGKEHFDHEDASGKRFIYSWRKQVDNARAALTAALSKPQPTDLTGNEE